MSGAVPLTIQEAALSPSDVRELKRLRTRLRFQYLRASPNRCDPHQNIIPACNLHRGQVDGLLLTIDLGDVGQGVRDTLAAAIAAREYRPAAVGLFPQTLDLVPVLC